MRTVEMKDLVVVPVNGRGLKGPHVAGTLLPTAAGSRLVPDGKQVSASAVGDAIRVQNGAAVCRSRIEQRHFSSLIEILPPFENKKCTLISHFHLVYLIGL